MTKKLIEVSLPLEAINVASAREKSIRHGHPSTLHLWWARRPLAACRAVLVSSLVDDPSEYMPDEESARIERERLFGIIEKLVIWENSNDEEVLYEAQLEIARSVARNLNVDVPVGKEAVREFLATKAPPVLDPFAGGGSIPLEAQRLGLRAYASDLNPVAVLINKALIEIPPKFANMPPVHPPVSTLNEVEGQGNSVKQGRKKKVVPQDELWVKKWKGAEGLAEDVRYYGKWMRDEAFKRIGHLYPSVTITNEILAERPDLKEQGLKAGDRLTVITWLWTRTITCPNPACGVQMPLIRSFALSKRRKIWLEPKIYNKPDNKEIQFEIKAGNGFRDEGTINRNGARCIACDTPVPLTYVRNEGKNKRIKEKMTTIVAETKKGRAYLMPNKEHLDAALKIDVQFRPEGEMPLKHRNFQPPIYGMVSYGDLFTDRQAKALQTFIDVIKDLSVKFSNDSSIPVEYGLVLMTYLALALDRLVMTGNSLVRWNPSGEKAQHAFGRQALAMVWDFSEPNFFAEATGSANAAIELVADPLSLLGGVQGNANQIDAASGIFRDYAPMISTDPPYYDNICYADLSDFFYVWLRESMRLVYPELFATLLVPKATELVATASRFDGDSLKADQFFENGLRKVFENLRSITVPDFPMTVYYAFKQSETEDVEDDSDSDESIVETKVVSTGWETMLEGLLGNNFQITGTWPMRTEMKTRQIAMGANALASSIVLVCRPRPINVPSASRREFLSALKKELAPSLRELQQGSIAPVDLAQASIGPGMAVYSRYSAVLEADGKPMSVRTALGLINQALDEFLAEQEGEYDSDTRWALSWFEQFGHNEGQFGVADVLSRAKNTSVDGLSEAGIVEARGGKVRLIRRDELNTDWDPALDKRLTAWESAAHLIYALENGGEESAAELLAKLGPVAEVARDLAYRLYTVCERKGWSQDALGYNMLVVAWPRLKELAARRVEPGQGKLM